MSRRLPIESTAREHPRLTHLSTTLSEDSNILSMPTRDKIRVYLSTKLKCLSLLAQVLCHIQSELQVRGCLSVRHLPLDAIIATIMNHDDEAGDQEVVKNVLTGIGNRCQLSKLCIKP